MPVRQRQRPNVTPSDPSSPDRRPDDQGSLARRLQVIILIYPGVTLLDLIGPQTVLSAHSDIHLAWKTRELLISDTGVGVMPTSTFADCPDQVDVLLVPGGPGQVAVMQDRSVLEFLAQRGAAAGYVTSVCTGSVILGAAGLLKGYKATSHWAARELLGMFGAEPTPGRVVTDRNRITGGGVTAGIDFGLVLLEKLLGADVAKVTQLAMEYDPQPPFDAGSPEAAGPEIVQQVLEFLGPVAMQTISLAEVFHRNPDMASALAELESMSPTA